MKIAVYTCNGDMLLWIIGIITGLGLYDFLVHDWWKWWKDTEGQPS